MTIDTKKLAVEADEAIHVTPPPPEVDGRAVLRQKIIEMDQEKARKLKQYVGWLQNIIETKKAVLETYTFCIHPGDGCYDQPRGVTVMDEETVEMLRKLVVGSLTGSIAWYKQEIRKLAEEAPTLEGKNEG